ncbi:MAG: hypothetical protein FVQ80_00050 [Planctomycetes bacterium]|nr:hypothetical protein [Planctomycetota bacterium]
MSKINLKYEQEFAEFFNAKNAFSLWKGRVALYAILKALGVGQGDEVILPGYTCVVDVNPIKYLGAKPVYVDITLDTYNLDASLLEAKITDKTKVIIAQHTYGYPCDMDAIGDIAARRGVTVIEDSCLAFGSTYKGKVTGTFCKAAYFSSQWNKFYTTGIGGMVLVNDEELSSKIAEVCGQELCQPSPKEIIMLICQLMVYRTFIYPRTTALAQSIFRFLTKKGVVVGSSKYDEYSAASIEEDFFKAMSSVQALSGQRQLKKAHGNISHRKKLAALYDKLLEENGWRGRDYDRSIYDPVMVRYPIRIKEKEKALAQAAGDGIELGSWFDSVLHQVETSLDAYNYEVGMCPNAEKAAREVVNLPLHPRANFATVKRSVEFIARFTQAD